MKFRYKALKSSGGVYETTGEFETKDALFALLREHGETLVSFEAIEKKSIIAKLKSVQLTGVKQIHKILFARNLSAMLEAGLPLSRALSVLEKQSKAGKFRNIVGDLVVEINIGRSFSDALKKYDDVFSPLFISMVHAGEESGTMVASLGSVADQLERSYKLKKKVKGAMIYPSVIISAMVLISILMMIFVVPTLTATFKDLNVDLPTSTKIIVGLSDFMKNNAILVFVGIFALIGGFIASLKTKVGGRIFDTVVLRLPVVGFMVKEVNIARTTSTLSSLLSSGVEIVQAVDITYEVVQNIHYKKVLEEMKETVQKGGLMSDAFTKHENLFPPLAAEMASVGEETGKVSELLGRVAEFYEADVEEKTKNLSTVIEPFLMVLIGGGVGFFAVSMITPMYSITSGL